MWRLVASWEAVRQGNLLRRQNISSAIPPRQPLSFVRAEHRLPRRVRPTRCFLLLLVHFKTLEVWLRYGFLDFGRQPRSSPSSSGWSGRGYFSRQLVDGGEESQHPTSLEV